MSAFEERKDRAFAAILGAINTEAGEYSVDLFVSHHLEELPGTYWVALLGTESPGPEEVLSRLEFLESWGDSELEYFDFSLPGGVTDYRICVHFSEAGVIDGISMES